MIPLNVERIPRSNKGERGKRETDQQENVSWKLDTSHDRKTLIVITENGDYKVSIKETIQSFLNLLIDS